jgi:signal transduction histidine kinase
MVRRAARRVAAQVAAAVGAAMLVMVAVLMAVVVRSENRTADHLLRRTAEVADDVGDPPPETWIVFRDAARVQSTPGLPPAVSTVLVAAAPTANHTARLQSYSSAGVHYRLLTQRRGDRVVQVVLNRVSQDRERHHLYRAAAVVSVAGLLAAAGLGLVVGRNAVRPMRTALSLQRRFVADAGHELRTPLTLLSTRAQLLEREVGAEDPTVAADVRGLVADARRLGEVVEDLLMAADPREQQPRTEVNLSALAEEVLATTAAHAAVAGVHLRRDAPQSASVLGVEAALRRALLALVDNAIDHTPADGSVELTVRQDRANVVLTVSDTGPGIAPAAAERIFERFHSGGHRSGRTTYGLGLALTHDVVDRHGGRLRLLPGAPGAGATFEITLPAAPR